MRSIRFRTEMLFLGSSLRIVHQIRATPIVAKTLANNNNICEPPSFQVLEEVSYNFVVFKSPILPISKVMWRRFEKKTRN